MTNQAIYAFSGDPITLGHLDLIQRALRAFDRVLVAIGQNPQKKYLFSAAERLALARESLRKLPRVEVRAFEGLLTDFAYEQGIPTVIRGVRDAADLSAEQTLFQVARSQWPGFDMHLLFADPRLAHVSSGAAKAVQLEHGFVHDLVPLPVKAALELKVSGQVLIGVTGETGAGKSHVCRALLEKFQGLGVPAQHIELDRLSHEILESDAFPAYQEARAQISREFSVPQAPGSGFLDRRSLGRAALADKPGAGRLNALMFEPMLLKLKRELRGKRGIMLLDSALLAELDLSFICNHRVLLVSAPATLRRKRLSQREAADYSGLQLSADEKQARIVARQQDADFGQLWSLANDGRDLEGSLEQLAKDWMASFQFQDARHAPAAA